MPTLYVVDVALKAKSGIPDDDAHNIWTFHQTGTVDHAADGVELHTRMQDFYTTTPPGQTVGTDAWISTDRQDSPFAEVTVYATTDLSGATDLGPPVFGPLGFDRVNEPSGASPNLPNEVAICMSFHADLDGIPETADNPSPPPAKIRPRSRRRGRVFLGPLNTNTIFEHATTDTPTVIEGVAEQIAAAAADLEGWNSGHTMDWVVWSRTAGAVYEVEAGYVDLAFDTQRRRGVASPARVPWS